MTFKISPFIALLFAALLTGTGVMQTDLKDGPQLIMLCLAGLTLTAFLTRRYFIEIVLFNLLFGIMLYINCFLLTNWLIYTIAPMKVDYEHPVMDLRWIWGVIAGLAVAPLALTLYHRFGLRNRVLEMWVTAVFMAMATVIYIVCELQ